MRMRRYRHPLILKIKSEAVPPTISDMNRVRMRSRWSATVVSQSSSFVTSRIDRMRLITCANAHNSGIMLSTTVAGMQPTKDRWGIETLDTRAY
jgi:hypothetical protein